MKDVRATQFDVIVVGAGPAGSMAARRLAHNGAQVVVLEEHEQVGAPCHCTGLVSPRTLELAGISPCEVALRSFTRARIWGPRGSVAWLESNRIQAVAIDRPELDRFLAQQAEEAGARPWLGIRAEYFERIDGGVRIIASNGKGQERVQAPIVIGADGVNSVVARWFNGGCVQELLPALKADVCFEGAGAKEIEIFVGNEIAPGWFGWVIPLEDGHARLGLGGTCRDIIRRFKNFLELVRGHFGPFDVLDQRSWLIPVQPSPRIAFDHGLLVGDAAQQAKPSSGGGVYMGMRAGMLAARVALEALRMGDFCYMTLGEYEKEWLREEGDELRYSHWLRSIYNRMNDVEIDQLVALCNQPWARVLIRYLGDIDFASQLFKPIHRALEVIAPRLLRRLSDRLRYEEADPLEKDLAELQIDPEMLLAGWLE